MDKIVNFTFKRASFEESYGLFSFVYENSFCNGETVSYTTTFRINDDNLAERWFRVPLELRKRLLNDLHLIFGITYWRLYCSPRITLDQQQLSLEQKHFWDLLYTKGLGEFFYKNKIDSRDLINFPFNDGLQPIATTWPLSDRSLVSIGGGKDSAVALEMTRELSQEITGFVLNKTLVHRSFLEAANINFIEVSWHVDPHAWDTNLSKEQLSGHIPYTAVCMFSAVFVAVLYNFRQVVFANEKSANFGNLEYLGAQINHQWSKSAEFEKMFTRYVSQFITPGVHPYSPIRDLLEIDVVKYFTRYPKYFSYFASCNKNFGQAETRYDIIWCNECPKCAFVFACLAAYLPVSEVKKIFGKNLYESTELGPVFEELLGLKGHKPFECVGTPKEMETALKRAVTKKEFRTALTDSLLQKLKSRQV